MVKECQAVGKATIFQSLAGNSVKPYLVPFAGKIVSWSISLARPTPKERKFFNDFYGSPSEARIAVLRQVKKRKPPVYKLVRQSPLEQLNGYFGQTPIFTLDHPLNVIPGQIVALSLAHLGAELGDQPLRQQHMARPAASPTAAPTTTSRSTAMPR